MSARRLHAKPVTAPRESKRAPRGSPGGAQEVQLDWRGTQEAQMQSRGGFVPQPQEIWTCSVPQGCITGHNRPATPVNLEYICLLLRNMQKHLGLAGSAAGAGSLLRVSKIFSTPCYLCRGAADLRASPTCRRPLCQQATADWLSAEMGHFFYPKLSFW